jgi:hypothetical protein
MTVAEVADGAAAPAAVLPAKLRSDTMTRLLTESGQSHCNQATFYFVGNFFGLPTILWGVSRPLAVRTSCGRHGFWPVTPVSMHQRRGTLASISWSKSSRRPRLRRRRSQATRLRSKLTRTKVFVEWNTGHLGETLNYTKDPSEIIKANPGLVKNAFTHTV